MGEQTEQTEQIDLPFTCSAAALGRAIGISEQAVSAYARQGVIVRTGRGQYNFLASICGYCAHLRSIATGKGGNEAVAAAAAAERGRLAKAMADKVEQENAARAGRLVDAGEVEREWSSVLRTVRAGMLAVPSRCAARLPHLSPQDIGEIDAEVRQMLTEIGR
jgi:phage terminase Nu1 subunit (DNA packaging protein)